MNILFLSQIVPYPPHGGVLQRGYNLLRQIGRRNRIHLMAFIHPDVLKGEEALRESRIELGRFCENIEYFRLEAKRSRFHFYKIVIQSFFKQVPFSVLAHRSKALEKRVSEIINSERIDIVHVDTIALAQFVENLTGRPKILTHHNIESKLLERRAAVEGNPLIRFYLKVLTKRLRRYEVEQCPHFDRNIVMSEVDETILRVLVPNIRTAIVPNGVDTEYFRPQDGHEPNSLIYVGGMNGFANKDAVLFFLKEIWPKIKTRNPRTKFYVIGQDPPPELLRMSAEDTQIQATGYVSDVRRFIARAAVFVVPLRVGGGTRLKILDALAMGKPVVSTSIGCEGISVRPDRDILVADDPEDFAEKSLDLLENPQKRESLGRAGRKLVESIYSWEIIGKKLQNVYEEALEQNKSLKGRD